MIARSRVGNRLPADRLLDRSCSAASTLFWIIGGDALGQRTQATWSDSTAWTSRGVQQPRARRVGGVPVLRPDLPALPVPGRRGLAVLARQACGARAHARPTPGSPAGRCCFSHSGSFATIKLSSDWNQLQEVARVLRGPRPCYGGAAGGVLHARVQQGTRKATLAAILLGGQAPPWRVSPAAPERPRVTTRSRDSPGWVDRHYLPARSSRPITALR